MQVQLVVVDHMDPDVNPSLATSLGMFYILSELSVPICEMGMIIPVTPPVAFVKIT